MLATDDIRSRTGHLAAWTVAAVVLLVVYSPCLLFDFAYHDDFYFWAYDGFRGHPQFQFFWLIGRPLQAYLVSCAGLLVGDVGDLGFVRLIAVLLTGVCAVLLAKSLRDGGADRFTARAAALAVFVLPAFSFAVFWVVATPFVAAAVLSILAAVACRSFTSRLGAGEAVYGLRTQVALWSSVALLLAALAAYPPFAMAFVLPTVGRLVFGKRDLDGASRPSVELAATAAILLVTAGLYFVVHRFVILPYCLAEYPHLADTLGPFRFEVTTDPLAKVAIFTDLSLKALSLWFLPPSRTVAAIVGATILAGAAAAAVRTVRAGEASFRELALRACGLVLLVVLGNLPLLAASGGHTEHRLVFVYSACVVLFLFASCNSLCQFLLPRVRAGTLATALTILVALGGWGTHRQLLLSAKASATELDYIRAKLREVPSSVSEVYVVRPSPGARFVGGKLVPYDNFQQPSSAYPQDVPWMVQAAMGGRRADAPLLAAPAGLRGQLPPGNFVLVSEGPLGSAPPPGAFVIDMNILDRSRSLTPQVAAETGAVLR